jgi:hypothetical protein
MDDELRHRMQTDLVGAMKRRDAPTVSALRVALAAIANAEAVDASGLTGTDRTASEVARRALTHADVRSVVLAERDDALATAAQVRAHGRSEAADELAARAEVLDRYLDAVPG